MKRCALIVLCLLALPVGAEARPFTQSEMRMVELAHDHWQQGPACREITFAALPRAEINASGRAWTCNLQIADDMPWDQACTTVAHEWGHLLQWPRPWHSESVGDLMSESPDTTEGCSNEADRRTFRALRKKCQKRSGKSKRRCVRRAHSAVYDY